MAQFYFIIYILGVLCNSLTEYLSIFARNVSLGGLDIPITVVDTYDQEVVVMFQYLYLRNILIQLCR